METPQHKANTPSPEKPRMRTSASVIYLFLVCVVFVVLAAVFVFFPRTKYSTLEKRELATFPDISAALDSPAVYTAAISHWFSDSEPFRDNFMTLSMNIRDSFRYKGVPGVTDDSEVISFHASDTPMEEAAASGAGPGDDAPGEFHNDNNGTSKLANAGIIIVGTGPDVRALMAYGGVGGGNLYAKALNEYADALPGVNVYAMVIPTSTEFYIPEKARSATKPQITTVRSVHDLLSTKVRFVDVYTPLSQHTDEDIFLRTDHHWAPRGAYYAARQLAHVAGVPFKDISNYTPKVIHGYVGSMYGYSKDISVKNAPEDFVYYVPQGISYTATSIPILTNKDFKATGEGKPRTVPFFSHKPDGSGNAYLAVYGSDAQLMKIKTGTQSSRRLLIIKDSYGNQLPAFLFYSFGEIHVVDFRYFTRNMKKYVAENNITDLAVCFNIFNVYGSAASNNIRKFLTQGDGTYAPTEPKTTTGDRKHDKDIAPSEPAAPAAKHEPANVPVAEPNPEPAPESPSVEL